MAISPDKDILNTILHGYRHGWFMMGDPESDTRIYWDNPRLRGIIELDCLMIPRRLRRRIRSDEYSATVNSDFTAILDACASRDSTWINTVVRTIYLALHRHGHAHSIEVWHEGELAGGLYGVALGAVFFGESMFSTRTDASKVALVYLVNLLLSSGFGLLDIQYPNAHLARLGATSIQRDDYLRRIATLVDQSGIDILATTLPSSGHELLARYHELRKPA